MRLGLQFWMLKFGKEGNGIWENGHVQIGNWRQMEFGYENLETGIRNGELLKKGNWCKLEFGKTTNVELWAKWEKLENGVKQIGSKYTADGA